LIVLEQKKTTAKTVPMWMGQTMKAESALSKAIADEKVSCCSTDVLIASNSHVTIIFRRSISAVNCAVMSTNSRTPNKVFILRMTSHKDECTLRKLRTAAE
jgi:hypothetical protein